MLALVSVPVSRTLPERMKVGSILLGDRKIALEMGRDVCWRTWRPCLGVGVTAASGSLA